MRYGIASTGDRVAPRCIFAESLRVIVLRRNSPESEGSAVLEDHGLLDLAKVLSEQRIDALICGGISREERAFVAARGVDIIDNVAGSVQEILSVLRAGTLHPGFGLAIPGTDGRRPADARTGLGVIDCVACIDRKCVRGEPCDAFPSPVPARDIDPETDRMLEASLDIASEDERTLCRLSELIYFCLELRYQRIGVAYCLDLQEPAAILTRVLRRFFKVYPVCCKIGGRVASDFVSEPREERQRRTPAIACNPIGQAQVLNRTGTDINVLVGMCMGADCIFTRYSDAPVTTIFVKDKSLANNPIGALYSDYYIKEAIRAEARGLDKDSI